MDKFNRNYILLIEKRDGSLLTIKPPFTIEFDIHRNSFSSANAGQIRIYNLSLNNRSQLRKDQYDYSSEQARRKIVLKAGYGDNLSLAFQGNITQAWSVREGVNMITQIESFDGGYAYVNAITGDQFPANTETRSIIDSFVQNLPGIQPGAIGNYEGKITRGNSFNGNTTDLLSEITGEGFFIDNGKAHCLKDDECLAGSIPIINAESGLLGTPILEQQFITFEMLFEPSLKIGQLIQLESQTATHFNGLHKVISLVHRGIISEAVSGNATTTVGLLPGSYTEVPEAS